MFRIQRPIAGALLLLMLVAVQAAAQADEAKPTARFAVVATPYVTALSEADLNPSRKFIVKGAANGTEELLATIDHYKQSGEIDFALILGDLTWQGTDADYEKLDEMLLSRLDVPFYLVPMSLKPDDNRGDLADGGKTFLKHFGQKYGARLRGMINHKGVIVAFNGPEINELDAQQEYTEWLARELSSAGDAKAVLLAGNTPLLFGSRVNDTAVGKKAWSLADKHHVAGVINSTRYAPSSDLYNQLPVWAAPPMTWSGSPDYELSLVSVFEDRIEVDYLNREQPAITLNVPNPKNADRLDAEKDPYGLPPYSQDLARSPDLTFVLLGDPQLDDQTVASQVSMYQLSEKMSRAIIPEVNRLKPELTLIAGDCTNKNTLAEWETFREIYGQLKMPTYPVPGNHDAGATPAMLSGKVDLGEYTAVKTASAEFAKQQLEPQGISGPVALFQHFTRDFANQGKPNYVFQAEGGVTFICLDNSTLNDEQVPDAGFVGYGEQQLGWLKEQLEASTDARHVFVVAHFPINRRFGGTGSPWYELQRERVQTLCDQYGVVAFLSGHRHRTFHAATDRLMHIVADDFCWQEQTSYWIVHVFEDEIVFALKPFHAPRHPAPNALYTRITFPEPRAKKQ